MLASSKDENETLAQKVEDLKNQLMTAQLNPPSAVVHPKLTLLRYKVSTIVC